LSTPSSLHKPSTPLLTFTELAEGNPQQVLYLHRAAEAGNLPYKMRAGQRVTTREALNTLVNQALNQQLTHTVAPTGRPVEQVFVEGVRALAAARNGRPLAHIEAAFSTTGRFPPASSSSQTPTSKLPAGINPTLDMMASWLSPEDYTLASREGIATGEALRELAASVTEAQQLHEKSRRATSTDARLADVTESERRDIMKRAHAILKNRRIRYDIACLAFDPFLMGLDGCLMTDCSTYVVWCLEHNYDPDTGKYKRQRTWSEREAILVRYDSHSWMFDPEGLHPRIVYNQLARHANDEWRSKLECLLESRDVWNAMFGFRDEDDAKLIGSAMKQLLDRDRRAA